MKQKILKEKEISTLDVVAQTIGTVFWVAAAFWTVKKAMS